MVVSAYYVVVLILISFEFRVYMQERGEIKLNTQSGSSYMIYSVVALDILCVAANPLWRTLGRSEMKIFTMASEAVLV